MSGSVEVGDKGMECYNLFGFTVLALSLVLGQLGLKGDMQRAAIKLGK
jgi:hypothetical protein